MEDIDKLDQVVYDTVHTYKNEKSGRRGCTAMADAIGLQRSTLQNKVDRNQEFAQLSLKEARSIMLAAGDVSILSVLSQQLGHMLVPLPLIDAPADTDLLAAWAEWSEEFGQTAASIKAALEDNEITHEEVATIKKEVLEDYEKALSLIAVLEGMSEPEDNVTSINKAKS